MLIGERDGEVHHHRRSTQYERAASIKEPMSKWCLGDTGMLDKVASKPLYNLWLALVRVVLLLVPLPIQDVGIPVLPTLSFGRYTLRSLGFGLRS